MSITKSLHAAKLLASAVALPLSPSSIDTRSFSSHEPCSLQTTRGLCEGCVMLSTDNHSHPR